MFCLAVNMDMQEQRVTSTAAVTDLKPIPSEKLTIDKMHVRSGSLKQMKSPITAASYPVASLQTATNSFSQDNIIGEGSLGRVYRAEFSNGKVNNFIFVLPIISWHPYHIYCLGFCNSY